MYLGNEINFSALEGKKLTRAEQTAEDEIVFETDDGSVYKMYHDQDCCESVEVEEIHGDLQDLVGQTVLQAESISFHNEETGCPPPGEYYDDSYTWTFYKIRSLRGDVTIRWFGSSNGYYSEEVSFAKVQ